MTSDALVSVVCRGCGRTYYLNGPQDRDHSFCIGESILRFPHIEKRSSRRPARQNVADREYQPRQTTQVGEMSDGNGTRVSGHVKFFNIDKGFGFIRRDGAQDVFVHANELRKSGIVDLSSVQTGVKLEFDTEPAEKGPKATNLRLMPEATAVPVSSAL